MKNILVTGAYGQLGKCIQKIHKTYPKLSFIFTTSKTLNIADKNSVERVFQNNTFNYCINCAAYTNVEKAEKEPKKAFLVNAEGVKNLAETCKKNNTTLIHISTDYVFDGKKKTPYTEEDKTNPINQYGKSKLAGEEYIKQILKNYFIIRASWLYSEFGKNFYKTILEKAKTEAKIYVTNTEIGCPTNANNLAKMILQVIQSENKTYGIYHFCDEKPMTWYDFALAIIKKNRLNDKVKIVKTNKNNTFANRPVYSVLRTRS